MEKQTITCHNVPNQLGTLLLIIIIIALVIAVIKGTRSTEPVFPENFVAVQQEKVESHTIQDINDFYTITAQIPSEKLDKENIMAAGIHSNIASRQEAWKIGGQIYQEEQALNEEFADRPMMKYEYDSSYSKSTSESMGTVSYVITAYEFTGGAHGMIYPQTFTFSRFGHLTIDDFLDLTDSNLVAVSTLLEEKLTLELGDLSDQTMTQAGLGLAYLDANGNFDPALCDCAPYTLHDNFTNFIITDEGITFIFAPYQVAAYAAGMPQVTLDWNELAPYLKIQ